MEQATAQQAAKLREPHHRKLFMPLSSSLMPGIHHNFINSARRAEDEGKQKTLRKKKLLKPVEDGI
jgi:hypothetical protein